MAAGTLQGIKGGMRVAGIGQGVPAVGMSRRHAAVPAMWDASDHTAAVIAENA